MPRTRTTISRPLPPRRGTVLVAAMWVVLILGALVLVFARTMRVELIASANRLAAEQASAIERGAEQYVLSLVEGTTGDPKSIMEAAAEAMPVGAVPGPSGERQPVGYFWIIRPEPGNERNWAFGVTDEAGKLNLNSASEDDLMALPGMTEEAAADIADWRDEDEESENGGAESSYYLSLTPPQLPYTAKNDRLESIDELRLVRGITNELLYGYDRNRDGVVDDNERSMGGRSTASNVSASAARGFAPFATVWTTEPNRGGTIQRVNVNDENPTALRNLLRSALEPARADAALQKARQGWNRRERPFTNVFDFGAKAGLKPDEFALVADQLTHTGQRNRSGLINVNTAPREVLMCLPDLEEGDADGLVSKRGTSSAGGVGWVAEALPPGPQGEVGPKAVAIGGRITGKSFQYSADIVAVSGDGRAFRRVKIVVDARQSPARVLYRKDLTALGWPLPEDIRLALRAGEQPGRYGSSMSSARR